MTATTRKQNGRSRFFFSRKQEQWVEVTGYRVGNIQLDEPILITADAHVVGHIIAPKIEVAGLVHGSTAALETHLLSTGQVWGDIYTEQLQIEPGGKLHGWVSAVDPDRFQQIRNAGIFPELDPAQLSADSSPEEKIALRSPDQINVLRQLQNEAASALAARAELEQSFDQRLQEVAGETAVKVNRLGSEVQQLQEQLQKQQQSTEAMQEVLNEREALIERQGNELAIAHELLKERNASLETLRQENGAHLEVINDLREKNSTLEGLLHSNEQKLDEVMGRAAALETALQNSITHAAEQKDALLRWQELAEATEKRAADLEIELKSLRFQSEENSRLLELLQEQRREIEKEWEKSLDELETLRQRDSGLLPEPAEKVLDRLADLETRAKLLPELEAQLVMMDALKARAKEAETLQHQLSKLAASHQEQEDQILWHRANLETNRQDLEKLRQANQALSKKLADLQAELTAQRKIGDKWQHRAERARSALQKREEKINQLRAERQDLREMVRRSRLQLNANEKELDHYLKEIERQGQQLAEARSLLIQRDLTLQKAAAKIDRQASTIDDFKQLAGERIKSLQTELSHVQQQLKEAIARANDPGHQIG